MNDRPPMTYEQAVATEDCEIAMNGILAALEHVAAISDRRIRSCIIASALMTVAQHLDGNDMPRETGIIYPGGITATIAMLIASKNLPGV